MNERLEKEWEQISSIQQLIEGEVIWTEEQVKELAQHFYNLALEDVRNYCKKERTIIFELVDGTRCDSDFRFGQANGIKGVLDFLDQLSKYSMSKYIDAEKLIALIDAKLEDLGMSGSVWVGRSVLQELKSDIITSLQQEQPNNMIQWTGNNLKEVIDFTGKSPRFGEWFKSWKEYENYVHTHNDILKLFCEDGSHYEVPVGAWIVKTPDGYNLPSIARFIHAKQEQSKVDLEKELHNYLKTHHLHIKDGGRIVFNNDDSPNFMCDIRDLARHFYELGLNARKEE